MIDSDGHIVLTGFENAKVLGTGQDSFIERSTILYGKNEYQAPEMHLGWIHDFSVDCWAFGILLHAMLFGRVGYSHLIQLIPCSHTMMT